MRYLILLSIVFSGIFTSTATDKFSVYFKTDQSELAAITNTAVLKQVVNHIRKHHNSGIIKIVGFTDHRGSLSYNQALSTERAQTIRQFLLDKGVTKSISIEARGEKFAKFTSDQNEMSQYRRVDIYTNYRDDNSYYSQYQQGQQKHLISIQKDTVLHLLKGTKLYIDQNSFDCDPNKPIELQASEYYDKSDFVMANLSSVTNRGELLESGGMLYVNAYQSGKKLSLKSGKTVGIEFKDREEDDSMDIFYGNLENGKIIWMTRFDMNQNMPEVESNGSYKGWTFSKRTYPDGKYIKTTWLEPQENNELVRVTRSNDAKTNAVICFDTTTLSNSYEGEKKETARADNKLVFNTRRLGWINCDRFTNPEVEKVDVFVKYEQTIMPNWVLVFEHINSVMPAGYMVNDKFIFNGVPVNSKVKLVGLYQKPDSDEVLLYQKDLTVKEEMTIKDPVFSVVPANQVAKVLKL